MNLFLKEHRLLIFVQFLQFVIIAGLLYLSGFRDVKMLLYTGLIGGFIFLVYLTIYYFSRREFFNCLENPVSDLEEMLTKSDDGPISEALSNLLISQYGLYKAEINRLQTEQNEHMKFMDLWIHQMKTPLSVIELMAADLDEPLSSDMREETDRMKRGLSTVLYMARLQAIEKDFHIKQVNILQLVQEVNKENKRFFIRNKIYPDLNIAEKVRVETDEKWLYFILTQLLQNAVKYSADRASSIYITVQEKAEKVLLEITDHGVGISKEDLPRLFDAFYTGENGRKFRESTGMGLFLVKEVVHYLGHEIEVESQVGNGATFRIVF